jgi:hypothetical protein
MVPGSLSNTDEGPFVPSADNVFLPHMGTGFFLFSEFGHKLISSSAKDKNRCYHGYDRKHEDYIVTAGSTIAPDSSGFLTTASTVGGFDLIYVTKDGEFSCVNHVGKTDFSGPIIATPIEGSSDWLVMVAGRKVASYESEGALEVFRIADPSKRGGRLEIISEKVIPSTFKDSPVDMA